MKQGVKNMAKQLLKKKLIALIPAIAPFALGVLGFIVVILAVVAPVAAAVESIEQAGENTAKFFERFGGFLTGKGWNTGEEAFFKLLNEEKLGCKNTKIVTATIMYYYQVSPNAQITDEDFKDIEEKVEEGETEPSDLPYGKMYPDLKKLVKKIRGGMGPYEDYVKDKFLESGPYNELLKSTPEKSDERNKLKDKIYDEILGISESIECENNYTYGYYNASCSGVTVTGDHAGTYPLEEYIAGVISKENGGAGPEGLKAQAIMARTYVLKQTNNCTVPIESSEAKQVFAPTDDEAYINAANETAGKVLMYDGNLISTYFASYPQAGYNSNKTAFPNFEPCGDVTCDDTTCTTTFYKMPTAEPFDLTTNIKNPSGDDWNGKHLNNQDGHCYGYSQVAGRDLEVNQGMDYVKLLETFHSSGVVISSAFEFSNGGWSIRDIAPTKSDQLYVSGNEVYDNVGQCVWYAKSRAMEILTELTGSNLADAEKTQKAIDSLKSTYGHARDWYKNTSNYFNKINDPNQPQAGSIIVWSGGNGHDYGHVAIIEEIDSEDGTITITDGWSSNSDKSSCPDTWNCVEFRKNTLSLEYFYNHYIKNGSSGYYKFEGYVNFVNSNF